jgi:hypothetical protein
MATIVDRNSSRIEKAGQDAQIHDLSAFPNHRVLAEWFDVAGTDDHASIINVADFGSGVPQPLQQRHFASMPNVSK